MTAYDENLRKVADALFTKADPKADQNVWDMAREVLKTVPQKEFQGAPGWTNVGTPVAPQWVKEPNQPLAPLPKWLRDNPAGGPPTTHKATNYFVQANQPMAPLPEWVQKMGTPVEGGPNTIMVPADKVNLSLSPELQALLQPHQDSERADLRVAVKRYREADTQIRRITGAAGEFDEQGENQRESTVDAVKRVVDGYTEAREVCLEIRKHVGIQGELVQAVKNMAEENNELRTKVNDTVEGASATKLLKLVEKFNGLTLLDKVRDAVRWAGQHQATAKLLQEELDRVRRILGASEADSWYSEDGNGYSMHETLTDAATRVMNELNEATEANIKHSCEKEMAAKSREIRAAFADQLIARMRVEYDLDSNASVANVVQWLRLIADEERKEQNS